MQLASPDAQEGRYTGASSWRIENEPSFVAACDRMGITAEIIKPPKTRGTRKRQQKIYEVSLDVHVAPARMHTSLHVRKEITYMVQ